MSKFLDQCKDAISIYGKNGDTSLEYIGVILCNNQIANFRVYRKRCDSVLKHINTIEPYHTMHTKYLKGFTDKSGVKLCDISQDHLSHEHVFRMMYKLPKTLTHEDSTLYIEKFFSSYPDSPYSIEIQSNVNHFSQITQCVQSPLLQLGIEFDKDCHLLGVKYYLAFHELEHCNRFLASYSKKNSLPLAFAETVSQICKNNFTPIFLGINNHKDKIESKLYFISKAFGHQIQNILPVSITLANTLGWNKALPQQDLEDLYSMGMYIEGIAISLHHADKWRLYINSLPRNR